MRLPIWRGSLKTVVHAILSPCAVYLHLYMYKCGCTYQGDPQSVQLSNATTTTEPIMQHNSIHKMSVLSPRALSPFIHVNLPGLWRHLFLVSCSCQELLPLTLSCCRRQWQTGWRCCAANSPTLASGISPTSRQFWGSSHSMAGFPA